MENQYIPFKTFNSPYVAEQIIAELKKNSIDVEVENEKQYFDPSFAFNPAEANIILKLKSNDFMKASDIINHFFEAQMKTIDKEHYLFQFSDQELKDILSKPDEWGSYDYQLAQKILVERGQEINNKELEALKKERNEELAKPEKASTLFIVTGYILAVFIGFVGIIIGWHIATNKKILPDGQKVWTYSQKDRNHGNIIRVISIISMAWFIITKLYNAYLSNS